MQWFVAQIMDGSNDRAAKGLARVPNSKMDLNCSAGEIDKIVGNGGMCRNDGAFSI